MRPGPIIREYSVGRSRLRKRELNILAREMGRNATRTLFDGLEGFDLPGGHGHRSTAQAVSAALDTPFRLTIDPDDDTKVDVGADRGLATYRFKDAITIGLDVEFKAVTETTAAIAETKFVYYDITKVGTAITATLTTSITYPVQADGTWSVILGRADFASGAITRVNQFWFGDIHFAARWG